MCSENIYKFGINVCRYRFYLLALPLRAETETVSSNWGDRFMCSCVCGQFPSLTLFVCSTRYFFRCVLVKRGCCGYRRIQCVYQIRIFVYWYCRELPIDVLRIFFLFRSFALSLPFELSLNIFIRIAHTRDDSNLFSHLLLSLIHLKHISQAVNIF